MTTPEATLSERLRALVILDEVRSDNPLGREAAGALDDKDAEIARLTARCIELGNEPTATGSWTRPTL